MTDQPKKYDRDGMAQVPIRVFWEWTQRGLWGIYEDDPQGDPKKWQGWCFGEADHNPHHDPPVGPGLSHYWWSDGNGGCDRNRSRYATEDADKCGEEIWIYKIEVMEFDLPALYPDVGGPELPDIETAEKKVAELKERRNHENRIPHD